ncbi:hypothetical protein Clacol_002978 [Clathrus columnatus]|uniref:ER membrane protein complex subunit 7 beta-sandwich domain-containing protein n=1 Tax=Clathrus columnatus TaxID=1419009 RepID=A0AAV5A287_9AGAM|nr:hypothetical protein Clacol_002978 [Clathrus columnatus]
MADIQHIVDVTKADPPISVYTFVPGTSLSNNTVISLPNPIILTPRAKNAYFAEKEGFNPIAMLQSPMMLLMIGTGVLLFLTPYLMSRMDPESLDEVREKQGKMLAAQSSISNMDIGGGLANLLGTNLEKDDKATSQASSTSTSVKPKSKPKRR